MKNHRFNPVIMRAYDIRGTYEEDLFDKDAYFLGRAIATILKMRKLPNTVCIGYDGRLSSPNLHTNLVEGLLHSGCAVSDIGLVATPTMYFASKTLDTAAGIMITGSHNPGHQNGFKIVMENKPFFGDDIQLLQTVANSGNLIEGLGQVDLIDIKPKYIEHLLKFAVSSLPKRVKIAWDPGNGATGEIVEMLAKQIQNAESVLINTKIDGHFPNHHPDPTIPENMKQLIRAVKDHNCDFGIAFDGDGDRLGIIDNKGDMIFGDQILLMLTQDLVKREPDLKVVCDVKTSDAVMKCIKQFGATPVMWKTGHSLIKAKMREIGSKLGGEMSGHLFFGENYYGFDDALFGACKMINIASNSSQTISEMVEKMPKSYSTPEIRIDIEEERKFDVIEKIKNDARSNKLEFNDLDGIRVSNDNMWWLVRASNTQNALIVRIEGATQAILDSSIQDMIGLFDKFNIDNTPLKTLLNQS